MCTRPGPKRRRVSQIAGAYVQLAGVVFEPRTQKPESTPPGIVKCVLFQMFFYSTLGGLYLTQSNAKLVNLRHRRAVSQPHTTHVKNVAKNLSKQNIGCYCAA